MGQIKRVYHRWVRFLNANIGRKIIFLFAPVYSLILISSLLTVYAVFSGELVKRVLYDTQLTIEKVKDNLDSYTSDMKNPLVQLANNTALLRLVEVDMQDISYASVIADERQVQGVLSNITTFKPYIGDVIIWGNNGYHHSMLQSARRDYSLPDAPWVGGELEREDGIRFLTPHPADYYATAYQPYESAVSAVLPIRSRGKTVGYVMCDISTEHIDRVLSNLSFVAESRVYLIDRENGAVYGPADEPPALDGESGYRVAGGELVVHTTLGCGWRLAVVSPYGQVVAPATKVLKICAAALAAGLLLTFLCAVVISRRIRRPIGELVERMNQVNNRDFTPVRASDQYGEIALIRGKFEGMVQRIDRLINEVYLSDMRQKEMEYENLVNQINPHFLYNVLQLIQTEAVLSDNEAIEDIVVRLSALMRYTMDRSRKIVTIGEEADYTDNYLALYRKRFENAFRYDIELDEELRGRPVIRLILQPVVENSIRHGLRDKKRGGEIHIRIFRLNGRILFEVTDNGCGITPERLREVRRRIESRGDGGGSIGLQNTNQRIRMQYGLEAGVTIESEAGAYTRVTCALPEREEPHVPRIAD